MLKSFRDDTVKGIRIRTLSRIFYVIMCIVCLLIVIMLINVRICYSKVVSIMDDYVECDKAVTDFSKATNYLTNQSRFFIVTQEPAYIDNYFSEYLTLKHREVSIEIVELTHNEDSVDVFLRRALNESNKLSKTELYAMRLSCEANDFDFGQYPEISKIVLKNGDEKLTKEEKQTKAKNLLFNNDYLYSKSRIDNLTNDVINELINNVLVENAIRNRQIRDFFIHTFISIFILLVVALVMHVVLFKLVIQPLTISVKNIENGTKMKISGAYEVNFIAKTYNDLCDKNILNASILKHKAEHDPLTGLINREAFDQIKEALRDVEEPIAYLLVDIDLFKGINDKYGHLVGDDVLRKISNLLMEQFRVTDYVARIGGDEFAIIMTKFGDSPTEIIQKKIEGLNYMLQNVEDGLPTVSLSVGVAFSKLGYKDFLLEQADKALYTVKRGGRCNCSFFKEV